MSRAEWPLDMMLQDLRRLGLSYRGSIEDVCIWEAVCPCCHQWGLRLRERYRCSPVSLDCRGRGCDDGAIRWAFSADPLAWRVAELEEQLQEALDLADAAATVAHRGLELVARPIDHELREVA
jgi:hypothetical protein